ncbi:MAG: hypothetical protein JW816_01880 [Candidatus Buchananbacteria bacterium]|nr:hypothetical protein [Candidatus Buchananbacteria bacterium]
MSILKKTILPSILLFSLFIFSGCSSQNNNQTVDVGNQDAVVQSQLLTEQVEKDYQVQLANILAPYWLTGQFTGIKDQILDLRAPSQDLNLHLNLVLALQDLEDGTNDNDQEKIDQAKKRIDQLANQYDWLKSK